MILIYHNPNCRIAGKCLKILETNAEIKHNVEHHNLVLTKEKLNKILKLLNFKPTEIIKKRHFLWKGILNRLSFTDDELVEIIIQYPRLLKNPIIINGNKAVIGHPPERILDII